MAVMQQSDARLRVAAAGDAILTRRLSPLTDPPFRRLYDLVRDTDAAVVNMEMLLNDLEGPPSAHGGYLYMGAPAWIAGELDWAGFDLFSAAHNHAFDYSHEGMEQTMRAFEERELPYAGLGRHLADARKPTYVDTPSGRVALIAASSTLLPECAAGPQRPDMQGRPGVSPLRVNTRHVLPPDLHAQLRDISDKLGLEEIKRRRAAHGLPPTFEEDDDEFEFLFLDGVGHAGRTISFEIGDEPRLDRWADERDVAAIVEQIRVADRRADRVVVSLHAHEGANGRYNDTTVPAFMQSFAQQCVTAGADIFVGHGPHQIRGIDSYEGVPLFYSLGNFALQHDMIDRFPASVYAGHGLGDDATPADLDDAGMFDKLRTERRYSESILPICEFDSGGLDSVTLYPLDLGVGREGPHQGYPGIATGKTATQILDRVSKLSEPFGTTIEISEERGYISL